MFNTGLQVGNSIGIARHRRDLLRPARQPVRAGRHRGRPAAAHRPGVGRRARQLTGRILTQFRGCLHDRLVAADPTVTPAACRIPGGQRALPAAAHPVLARAGGAAVSDDFAASVERTLWFQVGVFGLSFLVMLLLPRGAGRHRPGSGGAGPGESRLPRGAGHPGRGASGGPGMSAAAQPGPAAGRGPERLVILGATGGIGGYLLSWAVDAGHPVHVLARRPEAVPGRPGVTVTGGDATDPAAVADVVAGADAVLSALGPRGAKTPGLLGRPRRP